MSLAVAHLLDWMLLEVIKVVLVSSQRSTRALVTTKGKMIDWRDRNPKRQAKPWQEEMSLKVAVCGAPAKDILS